MNYNVVTISDKYSWNVSGLLTGILIFIWRYLLNYYLIMRKKWFAEKWFVGKLLVANCFALLLINCMNTDDVSCTTGSFASTDARVMHSECRSDFFKYGWVFGKEKFVISGLIKYCYYCYKMFLFIAALKCHERIEKLLFPTTTLLMQTNGLDLLYHNFLEDVKIRINKT